MRSFLATLSGLLSAAAALAQPLPGLQIDIIGEPAPAVQRQSSTCDARDYPDTPARAIRLSDDRVQLYATDRENRVDAGPDLLHLQHECAVVYRGGGKDDPSAYDDRSWLASPWTDDGQTIWAVLHNEFHGQLRKRSARPDATWIAGSTP